MCVVCSILSRCEFRVPAGRRTQDRKTPREISLIYGVASFQSAISTLNFRCSPSQDRVWVHFFPAFLCCCCCCCWRWWLCDGNCLSQPELQQFIKTYRSRAYKVLFAKRNMLTQLHCVRSSWHILQTLFVFFSFRGRFVLFCVYLFSFVYFLFLSSCSCFSLYENVQSVAPAMNERDALTERCAKHWRLEVGKRNTRRSHYLVSLNGN